MTKNPKITVMLTVALFTTTSIMGQENKKSELVHVNKSAVINVSQEELWNITALNFANIGKWATAVNHSAGFGEGKNGAVCSERVCEPSIKRFNKTTESFLEYDARNYRFKYEIKNGLPKIVSKAYNEWTHIKEAGGTKITMSIDLELKGFFAQLMKRIIVKKMESNLNEIMQELKFYAETGEVHPRKKAAMVKYEKEQSSKQQTK